MDKNFIKNKLRESLIPETNGTPISQLPPDERDMADREYAAAKRALTDTMLTKSQVMGAAGLGDPDDAGDRKAFNAKLDREKTPEGSIRKFTDQELAAVTKVISNPKSYLNVKVR